MSISTAKNLTLEYLRECFTYNAETGLLIWNVRPSRHFPNNNDGGFNTRFSHRNAGTKLRDHLAVQVAGDKHYVHRIGWALHYGQYPDGPLDHINGNGFDNRIVNLREVSHEDNTHNQKIRKNNKSGCMGVSYRKDSGKFTARINTPSGRKNIGVYANLDDAIAARKEAEKHYGYHENHGR